MTNEGGQILEGHKLSSPDEPKVHRQMVTCQHCWQNQNQQRPKKRTKSKQQKSCILSEIKYPDCVFHFISNFRQKYQQVEHK